MPSCYVPKQEGSAAGWSCEVSRRTSHPAKPMDGLALDRREDVPIGAGTTPSSRSIVSPMLWLLGLLRWLLRLPTATAAPAPPRTRTAPPRPVAAQRQRLSCEPGHHEW